MTDLPTPAALAATHAAAFPDERPWSADEFASLLSQKGVWLTGDADSFVLARIVADEVEILTLATAPAAQRRGLARGHLTNCIATARARGAASLFLEVAADNHAARALYAQAGFDAIGQRRGYYARSTGGPVDALVLRLQVPPL